MNQGAKSGGRRAFLAGLLTGAGLLTALGAVPRNVTAKKDLTQDELHTGPILYRRTAEVDRYYRTLYT